MVVKTAQFSFAQGISCSIFSDLRGGMRCTNPSNLKPFDRSSFGVYSYVIWPSEKGGENRLIWFCSGNKLFIFYCFLGGGEEDHP